MQFTFFFLCLPIMYTYKVSVNKNNAIVMIIFFQWSFGVLLWELVTLAQEPYAEVDPFEVESFLRDGYRLAQPANCPDEL